MSVNVTRRRTRVLIADDHAMVRAGLRSMLATEPDIDIVGEASTGGQTLVHARRLQPDVVLLDARLPDMPGWQVCRELCEAFPNLAVAILTAFMDDELVRQCVRAGARGYLLKMIEGTDLVSSIRSLAAGQSVIDRRVLPHVLAVARASPLDLEQPLRERQRTILSLVAEGFSNREIAAQLSLSDLTVKSYIEHLLNQLGARNRVHAVIIATRRGWL